MTMTRIRKVATPPSGPVPKSQRNAELDFKPHTILTTPTVSREDMLELWEAYGRLLPLYFIAPAFDPEQPLPATFDGVRELQVQMVQRLREMIVAQNERTGFMFLLGLFCFCCGLGVGLILSCLCAG